MPLTRLAEIIRQHDIHLTGRRGFSPATAADLPEAGSVTITRGASLHLSGPVNVTGTEIDIWGRNSALFLGAGARLLKAKIRIKGDNCIVFIGPDAKLRQVLVKCQGDGNTVALGAKATWESGAALCEPGDQTILVGDGCMISNYVNLRTDDGHGIFDRDSQQRINLPASIVLDRHVWLGNGARCNKGVRIESGTVLGADSVASGHLQGHCVYAGIPARKLRENVVWSRTDAFKDVPDNLLGPQPNSEPL